MTSKNSVFKQQLTAVNQRLKVAKLGVTIRQRGNRLYVRATLPPKPGTQQTKKQQDLPTSFKAQPAGLKPAENLAKQIAGELAGGTFDWTKYGFTPQKTGAQKTVAEWISAHEKNYFERRKRTPTTEASWRNHYGTYFNRLSQEASLTEEELRQAILMTEADSCTRSKICIAYKSLGNFAGLSTEFTRELKGTYSALRPAPRNLPSDEKIVQAINEIPNKAWRWAAGMVATYGLRPHEVFKLDLSRWPEVEVLQDTKTGLRTVRPLRHEWVNLFDLSTPQIPNVKCQINKLYGQRVSIAFRRYQVGFCPYDLRHAWAVRAITINLPVSIAAKLMGHSVEIHTKVYQTWISEKTEKEIFEEAITASNRPQAPTIKSSTNTI